MSIVTRVAKNTGVIIVGEISFRIISLFVIIYLARYLGVVDFGKYSFVFAYLSFFGIICELGLHVILVREMSRDALMTPKLVGNAYFIKLILTFFAIILSLIVISFLPYPPDTTSYIYIASFSLLFMSFSNFYSTIFQANLRMEYSIIAKLVFRVLSAFLIFWIIFSQGTLMQIMIALAVSEMIKTLINYLFSRKIVRPQFKIDFELWGYLLKAGLPLALISVMWIISFRIDVVMLSVMKGDADVGFYSAAYRLCEPLSIIPAALIASVFPIMSASFKRSEERIVKSYRLSMRYLFIVTLPIAIGTTLISDKIIFLIYGTEFAGSATALQILVWALVFTAANTVVGHLLVSIDKQKLWMFSTGLRTAANLTLNFLLIPILSYNGAAITTVATGAMLFAAGFYFTSKHLQVIPVHKMIVKPVISGLIMGAFVYYFVELNIFLLIFLAGVLYLAALIALKAFSKEDLDMFKQVLGSVRS